MVVYAVHMEEYFTPALPTTRMASQYGTISSTFHVPGCQPNGHGPWTRDTSTQLGARTSSDPGGSLPQDSVWSTRTAGQVTTFPPSRRGGHPSVCGQQIIWSCQRHTMPSGMTTSSAHIAASTISFTSFARRQEGGGTPPPPSVDGNSLGATSRMQCPVG